MISSYSWLPKAFFRQFTKFVNIYFVIITLLAFVPDSPKHPLLSAITLTVLMFLQALKEANEDYTKHKNQLTVNSTQCAVYSYGQLGFINRPWSDIKVGDIVTVWNNAEIPADILLLSCPGELALVDTTNIDGEMLVKEKYPFVKDYSQERLQFFHGVVKC